MITKWTSHLKNEEEKQNFERDILSAKRVLERLHVIMKEELEGLEQAENSPRNYDTPNWDYRQAHGNGFRSGLAFVNKVINLDQQKRD